VKRSAYLILEDGSVYPGEAFGGIGTTFGEVVFNTSMTGYQEILTDPSYAGQIVVPTYPIIGNYGTNGRDNESTRIQVSGFVVRSHCLTPSNPLNTAPVHEYLAEQSVVGISEIDTRAVTRRLRSKGVMMGIITSELSPELALAKLREMPTYGAMDYAALVTTSTRYSWDEPEVSGNLFGYNVVVIDCGLKYNILRLLRSRGCIVNVVPVSTSAQDILALKPHGVVFSPGPGDPALLDYATETVRHLVGRVPLMGICLGHQLLARAMGGRTFKLKFGHRGGNHPVRDVISGRVYITSQNHGYAVDPDSLPMDLDVSHVNLNDGTVEGLRHRQWPVVSIQFHSEASPGPRENEYLFDRFLEIMKQQGGRP
jgi:carbamoyl-phosphate synthase small subunit